ncbi:hypothetical protein ACFLVS_03130 [Chloroflexota bacterium]
MICEKLELTFNGLQIVSENGTVFGLKLTDTLGIWASFPQRSKVIPRKGARSVRRIVKYHFGSGVPYRGVLRSNPASCEIRELNQALFEWEKVYNTIRPHQAPGYLTPQQFLEQYQSKRREDMCH